MAMGSTDRYKLVERADFMAIATGHLWAYLKNYMYRYSNKTVTVWNNKRVCVCVCLILTFLYLQWL